MKNTIIGIALALVATMAVAQEWRVVESEDLMAGTQQTLLIGLAEISQGTLRDAGIVFRFEDGGVESYVNWGGYRLDRDTALIVRYGEDSPERHRVVLSTDHEAVFLRDPVRFMRRLVELGPEGTVVMQVERSTGVNSVARWIVGDLAEKVVDVTGALYIEGDSK